MGAESIWRWIRATQTELILQTHVNHKKTTEFMASLKAGCCIFRQLMIVRSRPQISGCSKCVSCDARMRTMTWRSGCLYRPQAIVGQVDRHDGSMSAITKCLLSFLSRPMSATCVLWQLNRLHYWTREKRGSSLSTEMVILSNCNLSKGSVSFEAGDG